MLEQVTNDHRKEAKWVGVIVAAFLVQQGYEMKIFQETNSTYKLFIYQMIFTNNMYAYIIIIYKYVIKSNIELIKIK